MAMSMGGGGDGPGTLAEINVTPLVDVMLVLLIIFMVTASVETVRMEQELEQRQRVERDLVPRKPKPPTNPLKNVPVVVPNTNVKKIQDSEVREPKVVLGSDLVFRIDEALVVDCKTFDARLVAAAPGGAVAKGWDANDEVATRAFMACAESAAAKIGPNALIQEKQRVNFAADRAIPWGWASQFMAIMGVQHGIKQVNVVVTAPAVGQGRP